MGNRIVEWMRHLEGIEVEVHHNEVVLAIDQLNAYDRCILYITMGELTGVQEQGVVDYMDALCISSVVRYLKCCSVQGYHILFATWAWVG